jgi:hypothetical protein
MFLKNIDKSHSKRDLKNIIDIFYFTLDKRFEDYEDLNKNELTKLLIDYINEIESIKPDYDILMIKTKYELIDYLEKPNQDKSLSIREKNQIMRYAKLVISFVKNGCLISSSSFKDERDLDDKCNLIRQYGNIPTCRRAIRLMNETYSFHKKYKLVISNKVLRELNCKKKVKEECTSNFKRHTGTFKISFD